MALLRLLFPVVLVVISAVVAWTGRRSGAGGGGSAFVIIDVQNCFTGNGSLAVPGGDDVIPTVNRLRSQYASHFDVVVLSQDWHCSDHVSFASQHSGYKTYDSINLTYVANTGQFSIA